MNYVLYYSEPGLVDYDNGPDHTLEWRPRQIHFSAESDEAAQQKALRWIKDNPVTLSHGPKKRVAYCCALELKRLPTEIPLLPFEKNGKGIDGEVLTNM